jgi:hypothetical protein
MKRILSRLFNSIFFVSITFRALSADTNAPPVAADLIRAAKATAQKLISLPASWTVKCSLAGNEVIRIEVVRVKDDQEWNFFQIEDGRREKICRLVQSDGIWHVLERGHFVKALPYQAELHFPGAYMFLSLAEPHCIIDESQLGGATFQGRGGSKLSYRLPLQEANRRMLEKMVSEYEKLGAGDPDSIKKPDMAQMIKQSRDLLANGIPLSIDEKTGILTETKVQPFSVEVTDFHWEAAVPSWKFEVPKDAEWEDQTKPWPESDYENCIMVEHDPLFVRGGQRQLALASYILNLRTEEIRRVPCHCVGSSAGSFLKGRHEVVISGMDSFEGAQLLKVNLLTGRNTKLESIGSSGAPEMNGEISPDGKQLASMAFFGGDSVRDFQIRLIDLETGKSKNIGKPGRIGAPFSWLPDGEGLILKRFEHVNDLNAIEPRVLCRMGLDGQLTDLRRGDTPLVLRKSRKILYQDDDTELWHTCNLDGSGSELFGDGFKGCDMPTVSADEKRIIFAYYEKGKLPQLMLFDMGKANGKPVGHAEGFTAMPVWR